ncbi:MAG: DsbE family thiol:disulfide interchange protein [Gammaproteobacteria bacterium]|nr:DsbE family thiol:disulfide interchange protein [Gammaproteobacteria bacterium]
MRYLVPLSVFVAIVVVLGIGLTRDPTEVPSPLVGKPAPEFRLPAIDNANETVALDDLKGRVTLLNVWASWCVACRDEHPLLVKMAEEEKIAIYGLNYKDEPEDARRWLATFGDPYVRSASDFKGEVGLDLGVYGVPETFVLDANGMIVHKVIGPLSERRWAKEIAPLIARLGSK